MVPLPQLVSILIASAATSACVQVSGSAHPSFSAEGTTARAAGVEPARQQGKSAERRALVRTGARSPNPERAAAPALPVPEPMPQAEPVQAAHGVAEGTPEPQPSGPVGRILAGSVAGAYAATLPRASAGPREARAALASTPVPRPSGWEPLVW